MDYFPRKSLSKYLITDTIDFNKHVHDIDIFINDKWRKYAGGDIGWLFKITRRLELRFWPRRKRSQPSQGDFFALQREPWFNAWVISLLTVNYNGEAFFFFLEMNQLETRIACGGHVCQWIGMKWAIFIEDLP